MQSIFITGIPAAGKTYLAKKLSAETGVKVISVDDLRDEVEEHPKYGKWVKLYEHMDEKEYFLNHTSEEQWIMMVKQTEGLWPYFMERTTPELKKGPRIIEGVNVLPHLAHKHFDFGGVALLGEDEETIYERIKADPRWGETEELQRLEAQVFIGREKGWYVGESKKYGYPTFRSADEAYETALEMMGER